MKTRTRMLIESLIFYSLLVLLLVGDVAGFIYFQKQRKNILDNEKRVKEEEKKIIYKKQLEYKKLKAQIPVFRQKLKDKERKDEQEKKEWLKKKQEFEKYLKIIPPYKKKPELIRIINDFAKKFKVKIKDLTTSEVKTTGVAGSIKKFSFSMKIEGEYKNVKKMLWYLENMPIIVQMEKGGFDFVSLNNEEGNFVVAARMFTYFFAK